MATKTIPIRSRKIGDSLADDYRAILLAILEENEEQRLYVGKRPEGMHLGHVLVLHTLIYVLTQVRIGSSKELTTILSYVPSIRLRTLCLHALLLPPVLSLNPWRYRCVLAPIAVPSNTSNVARQPAPGTKQNRRTKPPHRKQKGITSALVSVPVVHASKTHVPVDLKPIKELFDEDPTDNMVITMAHSSVSEDVDYLLDADPFAHPKSARKRPAHALEEQGGGASESRYTKRIKRSKGPLPSGIDIASSDASPMFTPLTVSTSLRPATQSMVSVPQLHRGTGRSSPNDVTSTGEADLSSRQPPA